MTKVVSVFFQDCIEFRCCKRQFLPRFSGKAIMSFFGAPRFKFLVRFVIFILNNLFICYVLLLLVFSILNCYYSCIKFEIQPLTRFPSRSFLKGKILTLKTTAFIF